MEKSVFKQSNSAKSTLNLTRNEAKILGKFLEVKREKSVPLKQFKTRLFKTHNSSWTPVVHRPSNDQIFSDRKELILNWFDLWTGAQRCDFFDTILLHCTKRQLVHIQNWFIERVPLQHLDFTTVLPRFLSLYIFSFLDPRTLCRASKVSWHWKFLAEQDVVWLSKCLVHGWFLPFTPSLHEYGAWKHHYIACCLSLDLETGEDSIVIRKNSMKDRAELAKSELISTRKALRLLCPEIGRETLLARPPWLPPDRFPHDLEDSRKAVLSGFNPNDPQIDPALLLYHSKFGTWANHIRYSAPAIVAARLISDVRRSEHHLLTDLEMEHGSQAVTVPLSQSLKLENLEERRIMELRGMMSDPPKPLPRIADWRPELSGGAEYPLPWEKLTVGSKDRKWLERPRILFISSRVAAAELLVDSALSEVLPIVYDYDSATVESLLFRLDRRLQGRRAKSIGIFVHSRSGPGRICLLRGADVGSENFALTPEFLRFFQQVAIHVVETEDGGHVDIFAPLLACESGVKLITELTLRTGIVYSAASGVTTRNDFLNSEWGMTPEGCSPTGLYFSPIKLIAWIKVADHISESCSALAEVAQKYFGKNNRDIIAKVIGATVFESTGLTQLGNLDKICEAVVDGLVHATQDFNTSDPLLSLADYLAGLSHRKHSKPTNGDPDDQFANSYCLDRDALSSRLHLNEKSADEEKYDGSAEKKSEVAVDSVSENGGLQTADDFGSSNDFLATKKTVSASATSVTFNHYSHRKEFEQGLLWKDISPAVDRRLSVVREVLLTEVDYLRTLEIIQKVFYSPCQAALDANRAIISSSNVQVIFRDVLQLTDVSSDLVSDLRLRLLGWNSQQCIGDIFVKFALKQKVYSNFIKGYPLILRAIEKCIEQFPLFRAFLRRYECTAASKMLTLPELLLAPSRRIADYISLLRSYQLEVSRSHSDHQDVDLALNQLVDMNKLIQEYKLRCQQERQLLKIQKKIIKCPVLLEANRFLVKELDVCGLLPPSENVIPKLRVYRHIENLGLHLFNDCLVLTKRTTRFLPFERSKEDIYTFVNCCELVRLRIDDIPDSKYVSNAFRMFTPNREFFCSADSSEDKIDWISILEKTINAALEDLD